VKNSLASPTILKHFGKSTRAQYLTHLDSVLQSPEAKKLVESIVRKN
jgi:hypothetical protein